MDYGREYKTIRALRRGETVELGGMKFRMVRQPSGEEANVRPGDFYVAERNTGPHLLEAREIDSRGWITPTSSDYPFDIGECVRVEEVLDGDGPAFGQPTGS